MEIKKLDLAEARQVCDEHMMYDFPDNERKPFSSIEGMARKGWYRCLGFYEEERLAAYAFWIFADDIMDTGNGCGMGRKGRIE